jgi:hypothetical protein
MRVNSCENCGAAVYFDNVVCENCSNALGFDAEHREMRTLFSNGNGQVATKARRGPAKVYCANYEHHVCNWLVPESSQGSLCLSCGLNETIPDLTVTENIEHWFEFEKAKRRLIYALLKLGLPIGNAGTASDAPPLSFAIVAGEKTGHQNGLITLNLKEADPAIRERTREQMNEPYRTLLGHVRHESGHYYWMALVNNDRWLPRFRELFGDETLDYGEALKAYHENGPQADWSQNFISAYATAHPWEDWAESWAHYLHMVEALETAVDYRIDPALPTVRHRRSWFSQQPTDPFKAASAKPLIDRWIPLALAMNSLNRSMGLSDFYPFVISPSAATKLEFIHDLIRSARVR